MALLKCALVLKNIIPFGIERFYRLIVPGISWTDTSHGNINFPSPT